MFVQPRELERVVGSTEIKHTSSIHTKRDGHSKRNEKKETELRRASVSFASELTGHSYRL